MSQMIVVVFSLLWFLFAQKIKIILSVCAALITINDNSCYFITFSMGVEVATLIMLVCCLLVLSGIQ